MADYQLYMWGTNNKGNLGDGTISDRSSPVLVSGDRSYVDVAADAGHTIAIDTTGMVWCWGQGDYGEMGNNEINVSYSSPVAIARSGSYTQVATGRASCLAIDGSTGMVWGWGNGDNGRLGEGSAPQNVSSPVALARSASYTYIGAARENGFAIDGSDGMIWAWGKGDAGIIGNLTSGTNYSSPVSIARAGSYVAVEGNHSNTALAIDGSDGSIWGWGANGNGQLGNNDTSNQSSPVSVLGGRSYTAVDVGDYHTIAIDGSTGMVYTWGAGSNGELGNGVDNDNYSSPISIARAGSYRAIAAGGTTSYAIDSDGIVWAWGSAQYGRLGDDQDDVNYSSPVSIARNASFFKIDALTSYVGAIEGPFPEPPTPPTPGPVEPAGENEYANMEGFGRNAPGALDRFRKGLRSFIRNLP